MWVGIISPTSGRWVASEGKVPKACSRNVPGLLPPPLDVKVVAVLVELERFAEAAERAGSPAATALRNGLRDAAQLKTRPSEPCRRWTRAGRSEEAGVS